MRTNHVLMGGCAHESLQERGKLFEDEPSQWGLRGDPHLWQELRIHLAATPIPADAQQLQPILEQAFQSLSGQPLATEEDYFFVSLRRWRDVQRHGLPRILARYVTTASQRAIRSGDSLLNKQEMG